jgi:hypothetical protein
VYVCVMRVSGEGVEVDAFGAFAGGGGGGGGGGDEHHNCDGAGAGQSMHLNASAEGRGKKRGGGDWMTTVVSNICRNIYTYIPPQKP